MSKPTGLILPPRITEPSFIETAPWNYITAAVWPNANQAIGVLLPKRATPVALTRLGVFVNTASGNIDIGVYTWDGSQFVRQVSTGSTPASGSAAMQYITPSTAFRYNGVTDVWLWVAANNTTVSLGRAAGVAGITAINNRVATKTSSFPLPSTINSATTTATQPYVYGGV